MEVPAIVISSFIQEGELYFFTEESPIGVKGHIHVCIKVANQILFFSTCTSQTNTVSNYVKFLNVDPNTFPCIKQDNTNKFTRELTYINCNNVTKLTKQEFSKLVADGIIKHMDGVISAENLQAIAKGVLLSTRVPDNIKKLFK